MIYAFIRDHLAGDFPVGTCCRVLGVSTSGYYHARSRGPSSRDCRRAVLAERVRLAHADSHGAYGSPRVARALRGSGVTICRNTAARIMRELGLRSKRARRGRIVTTDSSGTVRPAPNLLARRFVASQPDRVWLADITYIPLASGFAYLAAVLDLHSRAVVGWAIGDCLGAELACRALEAAVAARRPGPGLIHHSDRGVQYDCTQYRALLERHRMVQSMSRRGDCYDNAPMESFFATLKTECLGDTRLASLRDAADHVTAAIEGFYNRRRLHSSIGYTTPDKALRGIL